MVYTMYTDKIIQKVTDEKTWLDSTASTPC